MKTSILRGFIPTAKCPMFENADDGERIQLVGDFEDVHGCSESLTLNLRGELLSVSVTSVKAGDRVTIKRGGGMRDIDGDLCRGRRVADCPSTGPPGIAGRTSRCRTVPLCITSRGLAAAIVRPATAANFFLATERPHCGLEHGSEGRRRRLPVELDRVTSKQPRRVEQRRRARAGGSSCQLSQPSDYPGYCIDCGVLRKLEPWENVPAPAPVHTAAIAAPRAASLCRGSQRPVAQRLERPADSPGG